MSSEQRDRVLSAGSSLIDAGDSPVDAAERFSHTVRRLVEICVNINESITPPPISPAIIGVVSNVIDRIEIEAFEPIMHTFAERACPIIEDIRDKNMAAFIENANTIFSEVPEMAVNTVVSVLKERSLTQDQIDQVFSALHPLMRMALKRHVMVAFEESQLMSSNSLIEHTVDIAALDHAVSVFGLSAARPA